MHSISHDDLPDGSELSTQSILHLYLRSCLHLSSFMPLELAGLAALDDVRPPAILTAVGIAHMPTSRTSPSPNHAATLVFFF